MNFSELRWMPVEGNTRRSTTNIHWIPLESGLVTGGSRCRPLPNSPVSTAAYIITWLPGTSVTVDEIILAYLKMWLV
jgi:hypothetical protein